MLAIIERHDHDLLLLEHEAGNVKRRCEAQFLHLDTQLQTAASVIHSEADQVKSKSDPEHDEGRQREHDAPKSRRPATCALHTVHRFHSMAANPTDECDGAEGLARMDPGSKLALRLLRSLSIRRR
jgi:hypothetical protein